MYVCISLFSCNYFRVNQKRNLKITIQYHLRLGYYVKFILNVRAQFSSPVGNIIMVESVGTSIFFSSELREGTSYSFEFQTFKFTLRFMRNILSLKMINKYDDRIFFC